MFKSVFSPISDPGFLVSYVITLNASASRSVVDALMERLRESAPRSPAVSLVQLLRHTCRDVEGREAQGDRLKVQTGVVVV